MHNNLGKVNIKISSSIVDYDITIDRKVSVIIGDSGSGKTLLCDIINDVMLGNDTITQIQCKSSNNVQNIKLYNVRISEDNLISTIKERKNTIFFIDEVYTKITNKTFTALLDTTNYCVLLKRKPNAGFNISSNAVLYLKGELKTNKPLIKTEQFYKHLNEVVVSADDNIITEDGGEGLKFWRTLNQNAQSCGGYGSIVKHLKSINLNKLLVVLDSEALGNIISSVSVYCKQNNIKIFTPPCYEYIAMKGLNTITNTNVYKNIELQDVDYDSKKCKTWENYCKQVYKHTKIKTNNIIQQVSGRIDNMKKVLQSVGCIVK